MMTHAVNTLQITVDPVSVSPLVQRDPDKMDHLFTNSRLRFSLYSHSMVPGGLEVMS